MNDFKRITVKAAEEEDEVIIAGVGASARTGERSDDWAEVQPAKEVERTHVQPASQHTSVQDVDGPTASATGGSPKRKASDSTKAPDKGYRATTLEDLNSSPMTTTQKIVIVAALICIIGAVVYYLVAMR